MPPLLPPEPVISHKPRPLRRQVFTILGAFFVVGGLVSLALDDQPVSFALPEPDGSTLLLEPSNGAPLAVPAVAERQPPKRDDDLDRAFAHIVAELNQPR